MLAHTLLHTHSHSGNGNWVGGLTTTTDTTATHTFRKNYEYLLVTQYSCRYPQSAVKSYLLFYVFILKIASRHCCYFGCDYSEQKALSVHNVRLSIRLSVWLTNRLLSDRVKCQGSSGFPAFPGFSTFPVPLFIVFAAGKQSNGKREILRNGGKPLTFTGNSQDVCVCGCLKVP